MKYITASALVFFALGLMVPNVFGEYVPDWVKNTAGWWATDQISETEFLNAVEFLVKENIIQVNVSQTYETYQLPDWLVNNAGWWAARILTNSDFDFDPEYVKEELYPCDEGSTNLTCIEERINSHGFRGDEFEKEKPDNTFRIFALGGSTTFGSGTASDKTWPAYLQKIVNEESIGKKIEVINSGMSGATTKSEYDLIRNKIILLDPDLIIMYDGWNDFRNRNIPTDETIQNWKSVCELGKIAGFDTIIIVQPLSVTGYRVSTEQEITKSYSIFPYLQIYQQYVDAFEKLDKTCTKTADFRRIFDYVQEPVFYDNGHTMSFGNKIIAENVFSVSSSIYFGKTYPVTQNDLQIGDNELGTSVVYAVGADLSGKNFDNLNLQNAVFDKADLIDTSFKNTDIDGARFVFANLNNSNLLERTDLSNINLAGTDLSNINFKGKDLSGTILTGADLTDATLTGIDLSNKDLTGTILKDVDLSDTDFTGTILTYADLTGSILTGVDLSNKDLTETILKDVDLSDTDFTGTILTNADLTNAILPDDILSGNNFESAIFDGVDFSGKDLSNSNFQYASFDNANLEGANLEDANFIQVDFTKIKNKSLAGADLYGTSFAYSNLSGVNLADTILSPTNFWNADLPGVDFTVISDKSSHGSSFIDANLPDSNFEGVDLSYQEEYHKVFKNKAYLKNLSHIQVLNDLWGDVPAQVLILSLEVRGNDLAVDWINFNNFKNANLENANFKDADLRYAGFYLADLTNANLSGADLRNAFFGNADLSNVNLSDANLEGTILDDAILTGANLKCINHPICESG